MQKHTNTHTHTDVHTETILRKQVCADHKAIDLARQCESVKKKVTTYCKRSTHWTGDSRAIRNRHGRQQSKNPISPSTNPVLNHIHSCSRCGQSPKHDKRNYPTKDSVCYRCHKKGHFKAVSRSKREVREVLVRDDSQDKVLRCHTFWNRLTQFYRSSMDY